MSPEDPERLLAEATRYRAPGRSALRAIYLAAATVIGLGLLGALYLRGRPPAPAASGPSVPRPEALSPEDRAAYERALQAVEILRIAAVASRIRTAVPPEPEGVDSGD